MISYSNRMSMFIDMKEEEIKIDVFIHGLKTFSTNEIRETHRKKYRFFSHTDINILSIYLYCSTIHTTI